MIKSILRSVRFSVFHFLFLSVVIAPIFLQLSCSFEEPVAPQWDVRMAVPLIDKSLTMQELVDKNDFLLVNPEGVVSIDYEQDLDRFEVGDALQVSGINQSISSEIGKFRIVSPGSQVVSLAFGQIYPEASTLDGQNAVIPAFEYNGISASFPRFDNFESVLIESGLIRVTINNRLPVPLAAGLEMDVRSQDTDQSIFTILFDQEIAPGQTTSRSVNLYGLRIPANLKVVLSGGSPGSGGQEVPIQASTDGIDVETYISDIVAVEARAIIEEQQFSGADSIALGDTIVVKEAVIESGVFRFDFLNNIPLDLDLDLTLDDFYDPNGQPVRLFLPLRSGERTFRFINLSGYDFRPGQNDQGSVVRFHWTVQVLSSNGELITLRSDDSVELEVELSQLTFSEIRGVLKDVHVSLDTLEEDIDLPDGLDSLQFEAGRLELIINNGIGFPIRPVLSITGVNEETGRSVTLLVDEVIQPANGHPTISKIILDEQNSNLIALLNVMPNKLFVHGEAIIGDGTSESVIRSTDFIDSRVHITAPISMSYQSQTLKTEVDTIQIDEDAQKELRDNLLYGKLFARLGNHLPFGVQVTIYFSSRDTSVFSQPELTIGPLSLEPAQVVDGKVVAEAESDIQVELNKDEIAFFANDQIYSGFLIHIPGSNGQIVRVYSDDYLSVKAYGEFVYHVNPDNGNGQN